MAYGLRRGGEDESEIHLLDVATRRPLPDVLPRARYFGIAIKADKTGLYYSRFIGGQGSRVWYHAMGSGAQTDQEIFGEGYGPTQNIGVRLSEDGGWLLIVAGEGVPSKRSEIYIQDLAHAGPRLTILKEEGQWDPDFAGNDLLLTTNWRAPNRRIFRVDLNHPQRDQWREIVPESKLAIRGSSAAGGRLFVSYLDNVVTRIRQFDGDRKPLGEVELPGIGTASTPSGRWSSDEVFSLLHPLWNRPPATVSAWRAGNGRWWSGRKSLSIPATLR